jgi:MFS superfamily sulfate permease-like transporter
MNKFFNKQDLFSSIVVFLVALPLCMGISIASGVPPILGLLSGMIGGLVVGFFAGCPLQVSGPAAGLAVMVFAFVKDYGISSLGVLGIIVGSTQFLIYKLKLASYFKAVSPSLIKGLLSGIGLLILASQLHVALDLKPFGGGLENLIKFPSVLLSTVQSGVYAPLMVCLSTIAVILLWPRLFKKFSKIVPAQLVGIVYAGIVSNVFALNVNFINIDPEIFKNLNIISASSFQGISFGMILSGLAIAFVASAETLLSVAAVDKLSGAGISNYNKEMMAQGLGNALAGVFGALPLTGVIVRSSANINSGAKSKLSAIYHGAWLLVLVMFFSNLLALIPTSSLAAILILTGIKLIDFPSWKKIFQREKMEAIVYLISFSLIVSIDLLTGVVVGFVISVLMTVRNLKKLEFEKVDEGNKVKLILKGTASFLHIPQLVEFLHHQDIQEKDVSLHLCHLEYSDWAVEEEIHSWTKLREKQGLESSIVNTRIKAA